MELIYQGESQFDTFSLDFKNKLIYVENKEQKMIKYNRETKESNLSLIHNVLNIIHIKDNQYYYIRKNLIFDSNKEISNISNIK